MYYDQNVQGIFQDIQEAVHDIHGTVQEIEQYIIKFAKEYLEGKHSFNVGKNEFSSFGFDFYDLVMKGLDYLQHEEHPVYSGFNLTKYNLPDSIDWRDYGVINPIQKQGTFGCCYAFSALTAIEAQYAYKTGQLVKLSGRILVIFF